MSDHLPGNHDTWQTYWTAHGEPWRTEPEIAPERQHDLAARRTIEPNIERGVYPFKDEQLTRADVEWLLSTHESRGRVGPVDWAEAQQSGRKSIDIRGALLNGVDLHDLPLDMVQAGLTFDEFWERPPDVIEAATVHLENAKLEYASLRGAILLGAHLAHANLRRAKLQHARLYNAHLEGAFLSFAQLAGTNLRRATMDAHTNLYKAILSEKGYGQISLRDVQWNGVDVTVLDWHHLPFLGDERHAKERKRLRDFENASRANHQIATLLRSQGLAQYADRFAYRAQLYQRRVTRFGGLRALPAYLGSLLLDLISGYGYRPGRSLAAYAFVISIFAVIYSVLGQGIHPLTTQESIVVSMTAFHGRGFFATTFSPGDPQAIAAAIEAFVGLFIEVTFIATFTQRFFSR